MRTKVTFNPQAWYRDHAIDVDPEGDTVFYVDSSHLKKWPPEQLKGELEPYLDLPQLPDWIRNWQGPCCIELEEEPLVALQREGEGVYRYEQWSIQNPHLMDPADPDQQWYVTNDEAEALGPFDTLDEVCEYLTRRDTIDDWRGDLSMTIRSLGREDVSHEIASISDQEAMAYRDANEDPIAAAKLILATVPPLKYAVTIADTYTHYRTFEVEATSEAEARAKAERQYEQTYDAASVFEAFAMNGTEGEHTAIEVTELEPDEPQPA